MTSPFPGGQQAYNADGPTPLVLIVDDHDKNRKLARDVLRAAGFETVEAIDGDEAIRLAVELLPDVILLDLALPDRQGGDVRVKDNTRTARIPLVALSASRHVDGDWLLVTGFSGYLEKPISVAEFPDQVRAYCSRT